MSKLVIYLFLLAVVLNGVFSDCDDPGTVDNSARDLVGLSEGDTVNYTCNVGYKIAGEVQLTVTVIRSCDNGTWTGSQPTCQAIQCPDPGEIVNGNKSVTHYGYLGTVTYTCDPGFRTPSGSRVVILTCESDELWSKAVPTCIRVQCPPPEEIPDATHNDQNFVYEDRVTYTCNAGYEMTAGNKTLICNEVGGWTGSWPLCTRKVCGDPGDIQYASRLLTGIRYESTVHYICLDGFAPDPEAGPLNRTCDENATWTGIPPVCLGTLCGRPDEPSNATKIPTNPSYRYPDAVKYECESGFRPDYSGGGVSEITCQKDGIWDFKPMKCERIHCTELNQSVNAVEPTDIFYYQDVMVYTCKPGFELLSGNLSRTCLADGTFSGEVPVCTELSCPALVDPPHAVRDGDGQKFQDSVTYTCDPGYEVEGEVATFFRTLFCQANGEWTDSVPNCTPLDCGMPNIGAYLTIIYKNGTGFQDKIEVECESGYELDSGDLVRECQADKTWSGSEPICIPISCGEPPSKDHVTRLGSTFTYQSRVFYVCSPGYVKVSDGGGDFYQCLLNKTWGGVGSGMPECERLTCYKPQQIIGSTLLNDSSLEYRYEDRIVYTCDFGYEWDPNSGPLERTCSANKLWSGPAPICKRKSCGDPGELEGTTRQGFSFCYMDTVNYTCKPGFEVESGRAWSVITCQANGTWTGDFPSCKRIECPDPGIGEHATRVVEGFLYEDTIEYICEENYRVESGIYKLQCTETKAWSFPLPECVPVESINATEEVDSNMGPAVEGESSDLIGKICIICMSVEFGVMAILDITTIWKDLRIGMKNIRHGLRKIRGRKTVPEDKVLPLIQQD